MEHKLLPEHPEDEKYKNLKYVMVGENGEYVWLEKLWLTDRFCLAAREEKGVICTEILDPAYILDAV